MRKIIFGFAVLLCLSACGRQESGSQAPQAESSEPAAAQASQSESQRLNAWFEERYEEQLQFSPSQLTFIGRKDRYDELDDLSEEGEDRQLEWQRKTVEAMEREFDYDALTSDARISYDIWKYQYENALGNHAFRGNQYLFTQFFGPQAFIPMFMSNFHSVDEPGDMDAYIKRLGEAARLLNQLLHRAQKYAKNGVRPPRFAYEGVLQQARAVITGVPFTEGDDSALWSDANRKIDALVETGEIKVEEAGAYRESARAALIGDFKDFYESLIAWVESDIQRTDEQPSGVAGLPNGEAYYNELLASFTTTEMTAEEIHELGLAEVTRIRDDPQFYEPNTDEGRQAFIDDAEKKLAFINERLPDYFGVLPKADLVVKRVESYREEDGGAQHYAPGTPDGSRPGTYYMHLSDMGAMPLPQLEVIAYHEGNPGHHMQNSIALELEDVPTFRTQANFGAYGEGWGLYSELLASVQSEVRRYLVLPGQATSYKVGMIKIQELRARAEEALGDRFDIRAFHDTILTGGAMPLKLLERRVDHWIEEIRSTGGEQA